MRQLKITKRITNRESDTIRNYFSELNKCSLLTDQEEIEVATKASKGDTQALDTLIKSNLRFVVSVAKQFQHYGISLEDLINEGNIGLIKAANRFDVNRGYKFISYAVWWIRQSILQSISDNSRLVRIPSNQSVNLLKLNKTFSKLEQELEREPTDEELQEALKDTNVKLRDLIGANNKSISLDAPIRDGDDLCYHDVIKNENSSNPDDFFLKESINYDLKKVFKNLSDRQKDIVSMYFGIFGYDQMTLEQIGDKMDLTRERVRQIKDDALRTLKNRKNSKVLRQYI